ncbi:hypothetical protein ES705_25273 [subsurface metagenome]
MFVEQAVFGSGPVFDISEVGLPEQCVFWNLTVQSITESVSNGSWRLALGDQLPASATVMDALEPAFHGMGLQGAEPRLNRVLTDAMYLSIPMRKLVAAGGRRLVLEITGELVKWTIVRVSVVVSSIPNEVPDCLISEYRRGQ